MDYLDFEIEIGPGSGREYPIQVLNSPAGEAQETLLFPYDSLELENRLQALQIALLRSGGKRRKTLTAEEKAVLEFGRALFDALFTGEVRSRYDVSQGEADRQGAGLRIKLRIQSPELASLPWEFLYDPREAEFICFSRNRPMVRYIDIPRPVKPLKTNPPLQILGMVVGPRDLADLNVEREKQRVEEALRGFQEQGWVKLTWLEGGTWRDLQRALQVGTWHVFHFIGHGGFDSNSDEGLLALVDREGLADLKTSTQMGRLLADHHSLRLVILNACEGARGSQQDLFSSTAAILVRKGIPAVLAMQYEITDEAAIVFSRGFYDALVNGMPIDAAVAEARKAISLAVDNTIEWGTPVLYLRSPDGVIFDLAQTKPLETIAPPSTVEPADADQRLSELYNRANSAHWLEEWEAAARRFEEVIDQDPEYQDASAKLEHARRQLRLAGLEKQAQAARETADWPAAARALEAILAEDPDRVEAAEQLVEAQRQAELIDLYGEARSLIGAGEWPAALNVFARIDELDPTYPDPDGLRNQAQTELAALKRADRLRELRERALSEMDDGAWELARKTLLEVESLKPGDPEITRLLARVGSELAKEETQPEPPTPEAVVAPPAAKPLEEGILPGPAVAAEASSPPTVPPVVPAASPTTAIETTVPIWAEWLEHLKDVPQAFDQAGWNLFGRWFAANALGWLITWAAATFLENPVLNAAYNISIGIDNQAAWAKLGLYLLAAAGLVVGQGLVLRNLLPGMDRWRRLTIIGWLGGLLIPVLLDLNMTAFFPRAISLALTGAAVGVLQWTVLRNTLTKATLWIPANVLAWVLAAALGDGAFVLGETTPQSFLPGALVGIITGVALVVLTREGQPDQERVVPAVAGAVDRRPVDVAAGPAPPAKQIIEPTTPSTAFLGIDFTRLDWALFGSWFGANALGWALAWGLAALIRDPFFNFIWSGGVGIGDEWVDRILDMILGAGFALAQVLILRRFIPKVKGWWFATFIGWELGKYLAGPIVYPLVQSDQAGPIPFLMIIGTIIGATQWLTLRHHLAGAWWWIPASTLAWGLAAAPQSGAFSLGETTLQAFSPGAIMGLVSGLALVLLVGNKHSGTENLEGPY